MIRTELLGQAAIPAILLGWALIVVWVLHKMLDRSDEAQEQDPQRPADGMAHTPTTTQKTTQKDAQ